METKATKASKNQRQGKGTRTHSALSYMSLRVRQATELSTQMLRIPPPTKVFLMTNYVVFFPLTGSITT